MWTAAVAWVRVPFGRRGRVCENLSGARFFPGTLLCPVWVESCGGYSPAQLINQFASTVEVPRLLSRACFSSPLFERL